MLKSESEMAWGSVFCHVNLNSLFCHFHAQPGSALCMLPFLIFLFICSINEFENWSIFRLLLNNDLITNSFYICKRDANCYKL